MLRFGVLSDTHGSAQSIESALRAIGEVDGYMHLGDLASDAERIGVETDKPIYAVRGNCDAFLICKNEHPYELVVELEGARLLLVHGHMHEVDMYSTYATRQRALELNCCTLLYGHTHIPQLVHRDGIIVLNPGSTSRPRGGSNPSCGILEIDNAHVRARVLSIM